MPGRALAAQSSIPCSISSRAGRRAWPSSAPHNIHSAGVDEAGIVAKRCARDATLDTLALIIRAVQVNMRPGHLPPAEGNGVTYLKMPVGRI